MTPKARFISLAVGAAILLAVLIVAILYYRGQWTSLGTGDTSNADSRIRVAVLLNLTGPAARFDAPKQKTIQIAQERIAALNPGLPLAVRVLDAGGGPEGATIAVRQATDWGALWYLSGTSPTALAIAAQVRGRDPVVVQLANAANPDFGPPRPGEYRFWPDWRQEASVIVRHLLGEGMRRVLLIYSADPYSNALRKELRAGVADHGVALTELQFDPAATPDFRPALVRATNDGTDAVVVFGLPPGLTALFSQMSEAGWTGSTIGGVNTNIALATYDELKLPGPLWLVQTESMAKSPSPGSEVARFRAAYQETFNEQPAFYSLFLADALYFVAAAMSAPDVAGLSTVAAADAVTEFSSASGQIQVLPDRTLELRMHLTRVR